MTRAPVPMDADLFVVEDVASPGEVQALCSALGGSKIGSVVFFRSGGNAGSCIACLAAISVERSLWVSPRFGGLHPNLAKVVKHFVGKPQSKWRLITAEDFVTNAMKPRNASRFIMALVADDDLKALPGLRNFKNVLTAATFLQYVRRLDLNSCKAGPG